MNELNLVEMQNTPEKSAGGDRKSTVEEGLKNHDLTGVLSGEGSSIGGAPPDDLLLWKNPVLHHPSEMLLGDGGPLPHLLRRRNFGHWEKRDGIGACGELSRRRKTPNLTVALETGAAA